MSETKHTPGPWREGRSGGSIVAGPVPPPYPEPWPAGEDTAGLGDEELTRRWYGGEVIAESIQPSNRPLIIAAPDLYEAARQAVSYLAEQPDGGENSIALALMEAIWKAEGR